MVKRNDQQKQNPVRSASEAQDEVRSHPTGGLFWLLGRIYLWRGYCI